MKIRFSDFNMKREKSLHTLTFLGASAVIGSNSLATQTSLTHPTMLKIPSGPRLAHESAIVGAPTNSMHLSAPFPSVAFMTSSLILPLSMMTVSIPADFRVLTFFNERVVAMILSQENRLFARVAVARPTLVVPPRMRSVSRDSSFRDELKVPHAMLRIKT